ncbi:MAG: PIN domain-containing protein, partial [Smithella sp.]|nr:PIN domain-containing protein [Smithella sp.]
MILADTNIFLEILLDQGKSGDCKDFLDKNAGKIAISDFTLHSIGVILFRNGKKEEFALFLKDVLPKVELTSLPKSNYENVVEAGKVYNLDFDDAYQCAVARHYGYKLATM